ncbi:MAG: UDP-2,3-diacylglucosamine diphosphatase [Deltaproteobacteria bacterium]|nr:UDP-2,3-diacylglucosamine diphosphatase [Deltaproteobacteria bacterium]
MKAVFISDAHLKNPCDKNYQIILNFLDNLKDVNLLVILGDLFDFWNGRNKIAHKHHKPILDKLLKLKNSGAKIIYLEGNHDFFMGRIFTETLNADVYSDSAEITFDNKKIFLAHGDMVNKKDYGYRILRYFLRSWLMRIVFYILPSTMVWQIANAMSKGSRQYLAKGVKYDEMFIDYARDKWKQGYDAVMLGHAHSPKIFKQADNDSEKFYINPGDWISHFTCIVYEDKKFSMENFKI